VTRVTKAYHDGRYIVVTFHGKARAVRAIFKKIEEFSLELLTIQTNVLESPMKRAFNGLRKVAEMSQTRVNFADFTEGDRQCLTNSPSKNGSRRSESTPRQRFAAFLNGRYTTG